MVALKNHSEADCALGILHVIKVAHLYFSTTSRTNSPRVILPNPQSSYLVQPPRFPVLHCSDKVKESVHRIVD